MKFTDIPGKQIASCFQKNSLSSIRDIGEIWKMPFDTKDWQRVLQKKPDFDLERWIDLKMAKIYNITPWYLRDLKEDDIPTQEQLQVWAMEGVCDSVTGYTVEPDGHGPDGAPSWLLVFEIL